LSFWALLKIVAVALDPDFADRYVARHRGHCWRYRVDDTGGERVYPSYPKISEARLDALGTPPPEGAPLAAGHKIRKNSLRVSAARSAYRVEAG